MATHRAAEAARPRRSAWHTFLVWSPLACLGALYARTLCPYVVPGDPAELVTVAQTLGVCHPTGYPLYLVFARTLTRLFFFLPPQLVQNALSALCTVLLLAVLTRSLSRLQLPRPAVPLCIALLGLTPSLWRFSTYAEVYALHGLLVAGVLYALLEALGGGSVRALLLAIYLAGLATGAHMTAVLLLPALIVGVALGVRAHSEWRRPSRLAALAGSYALGASVLLLLFLLDRDGRPNYLSQVAAAEPQLQLHGAVRRFLYLSSAAQFHAASGLLPALHPAVLFGNVRTLLANMLPDNGLLIGLGVAGLCLPSAPGTRRVPFWRPVLGLVVLAWLVYLSTYLRFFQPILFLPAYVALVYGAANLLAWTRGAWAPLALAGVLILGVGLETTRRQFTRLDLSREADYEIKTRAMLAALEPNAVVFSTWGRSTVFWFHQWVEKVNPHVEVVNALPREWAHAAVVYRGRPQYFESVPAALPASEFVPFGWMYRRLEAKPKP